MRLLKIAFVIIIISFLAASASADPEEVSVTYIIDCAKGSHFEADVGALDKLVFKFEGEQYELNITEFCKSVFSHQEITGDVAIISAEKQVDLNEDGKSDVIVSHSNCVTGAGTVTVKMPDGNIGEAGDGGYFLTATWVIMLLTIVICVLIITYVTTRIYKARRRK